MKFQFTRLGAIDEATIELAPLTVICGLNNTGKTYATYAIYALLSAWRQLIDWEINFDSLRLLKSTHAGKVRVIYIDPPYNTGNKDWVYNDRYVGANDRWRHIQWLEFLYQRLMLAKDLLSQDGVIMVSINDENRARLHNASKL